MASLTWKNGKNIDRLTVEVRKSRDQLVDESIEALRLSVEEGALLTQDLLEQATTKTGEKRAELGGFPGRHDSGNMIASTSFTDKFRRGAAIIWGAFGWFAGEFEQYFKDQDLGEGNIPAARALPQAYARAEAAFKRRMRDVVRGRSVK